MRIYLKKKSFYIYIYTPCTNFQPEGQNNEKILPWQKIWIFKRREFFRFDPQDGNKYKESTEAY